MQIEMLDKAGFRWKHDPVSARIAIAGSEIFSKQTVGGHKEATSRENDASVIVHNNKLIGRSKFSWDIQFEKWKKYYMKHNRNPRSTSKILKDKRIYQWISEQRRERNKLSAERIELLDEAGFLWENSIRDVLKTHYH